MRLPTQRVLSVLCLVLGLSGALAQARDSVLTAIPDDALAFVVVHNVADVNRSIGEVAKLVQAPAPDLLSMAKAMTGLQKGLDEQGDIVQIVTRVDPMPTGVMLVPVANFADFFAGLNVKDPEKGVVEIQLAGSPSLAGRKGSYAVISADGNRELLEKFLASKNNLADDASLAAWLDANKASVVVTSQGIKQLVPKLVETILMLQAQVRQVAGENGQFAADGLNFYVDLLNAAEIELDQYGLGVRIDSANTIDLVKRVQFAPDGDWAKRVANTKPAPDDLLGGLEAGPFVLAFGGITPQGALHDLMQMSVKTMQNQPVFKLNAEQAQKYVDLSSQAMSGVRSMRMLLGVAKPGTGLFGNASVVMMVDDSKQYMEGYEKSLSAMHELAEETKSRLIPIPTSRHIKVGETDALEITADLPDVEQLKQAGGQDPQRFVKFFSGPELIAGSDGKIKTYVTADEHAVVMAYTSADRLKAALEHYRSKKPGFSAKADVAKVAAALPPGSQVVGYVSLAGIAKVVRQFASTLPGARPSAIPDFPDSPPLGMAVKVSPSGVEGHLIVTADTLRTIGDVVAKARHPATPPAEQ